MKYSCCVSMQGSRKTEWDEFIRRQLARFHCEGHTRVNCRTEKGQFISSVPVDHAEGARARLRICIEGRRRNWHSYLTTWASICPFRYCEMHAFPSPSSSTHAVKLFKNLISAPPSLFFLAAAWRAARAAAQLVFGGEETSAPEIDIWLDTGRIKN